ncbi:MFS transporter [Thermodesulfobacteriota bacterium]
MEFMQPLTLFKEKIKEGIHKAWQFLKPGPEAWKGAGLGLVCTLILFILYSFYPVLTVASPNWVAPLTVLYFLVCTILLVFLLQLLLHLLAGLPDLFQTMLFATVIFFATAFSSVFTGAGTNAIIVSVVIAFSMAGAGVWVIIRGEIKKRTFGNKVLLTITTLTGLAGIVFMLSWFLIEGYSTEAPPNAAALKGTPLALISKTDPSLPGPLKVKYLAYGSGTDKRRVEYSLKADLISRSVDGSKFIEGWDGPGGWARTRYWGFDVKELPLQARVWYPDGPGPFPLVLIVHGNHSMEDFSEPGYEYIGQLLASRGFILASIDEDFLNGSMSDAFLSLPGGKSGLRVENDARAWLLLEHLRLWREWSEKTDNPFYGIVDWNNLALIGHSRGGEAAATAAAFNRLPFYPDNALVKFNYGFNIRSVVAIAPCDGQYQPASLPTKLENLNYLVLQGSHDMDAQSFLGARQFSRISFSGEEHFFKCALYIYGANHGQFNSVWGRHDYSSPIIEMMNVKPVMPFEDQQKIGKVYISAFLEATLHGVKGYERIFQDYRSAKEWLPPTIYLSQYVDSDTRMICTFQEDINLTSADLPDVQLNGENLKLWSEKKVSMKWGTRDTNAVYLGWDNSKDQKKASYTITLPETEFNCSPDSSLVFAMADTGQDPPEDDSEKDSDKPVQESEPDKTEKPELKFIDCSIVVKDRAGVSAVLPLTHYSGLQPVIKVQVAKAAFMNKNKDSEVVFQSFEFPFSDFVKVNPDFNPEELHQVAFVFDRTTKGVVVLDDIGFRTERGHP